MVGKVLLCNGRFSQTERVELVHNDESGSDDRRYPRGMRHGNEPPGSIAAQWIQASFSVSMRSVRAAHTVLCYTKCFGTLDVKLVILAFPVARMRSVILPFVPCLILIFKPIRIILVEIFWVVIFVAQTVRAVVRAAGLVLRWGAWFVLRLMIDRSF